MPTIQEQYAQNHEGSAAAYVDAMGLFPDGVTHDTRYVMPFPIVVTHANGSRKWDVDGNEYVDYVMGHGALLLGHGRPEVIQAVTDALQKGTHLGASHREEVEWARLVQRLVPSAERVRFTASGTEATMLALRLARAYTGKTHVLRFTNHFHGWNDLLLAGAGRNMGGIAPEVAALSYVVPPNDPEQVERALEAHDDIAAVILEPTGASMGSAPVYPEFLHALRALTEKHGVLLIFDEVVTGFRISPGGAQALYGVTPDITTLAKILAGGLPGGAVCGRADILDMIAHREGAGENRVAHAGTFNANPVSAAAGAAALRLVATGEPNATADARATTLRAGLNDLLTRLEVPGCCLRRRVDLPDTPGRAVPVLRRGAPAPGGGAARDIARGGRGDASRRHQRRHRPHGRSPLRPRLLSPHGGRHPGNPGLLRGGVRRAPCRRAAVVGGGLGLTG